MTKTLYIRKARHEWYCCKCGRQISPGERYRDMEIKNYGDDDLVIISHERSCLCCPRPHYRFHQKEPVTFKGTKEWLVGKGYDRDGHKRLLTIDWDFGEYHWRQKVRDYAGASLYFGNVEFV